MKEVIDYVLEDKRDPKLVADHLQKVIDEPVGKLLYSRDPCKGFMGEIIQSTTSGELKWEGTKVSLRTLPDEGGVSYDLMAPSEEFLVGTTYLRVFSPPEGLLKPAAIVELNREDKRFFKLIIEMNNARIKSKN